MIILKPLFLGDVNNKTFCKFHKRHWDKVFGVNTSIRWPLVFGANSQVNENRSLKLEQEKSFD